MNRTIDRIRSGILLAFAVFILVISAKAVVKSINLVASGEPVAKTKISIFNAEGKKISEPDEESDEKGVIAFDFPSEGTYRIFTEGGLLSGTATIAEGGSATVVVNMNESAWSDTEVESDSPIPDEIRSDPQALYDFFQNFSGSYMEYSDAWNSLDDDEQNAVREIEIEEEEKAYSDAQAEQAQLDEELEALRGTENEAYMAAFFQNFLFEPETDLETAFQSHQNTLVELNNDPAQLAAERAYYSQEIQVILEDLMRQYRLSLLDEKSELARARREATRATRDFIKQAEADGVWTDAEEEEFWRLHDHESDVWQYTPEEEAQLAAQQGVRDQVFSEIMVGAYLMGGIGEEDKLKRQANADTAQVIVDIQKFDIPGLGTINLTFTGEMADQLVADIFNQKELYLEAENIMYAAQVYAARTDITEVQRRAAEQIYWMAYMAKFSAEDAMYWDAAVILLGTSADFALLGLGGPIEKLANKIGGGIRGIWSRLFKGKPKLSTAPRGTSGVLEPGQSYFDDIAKKGAQKAEELGVNAAEVENAVNRATNPTRPEGAMGRAAKYISVNDLKVLSEFDQIVQNALDAGVRQPVVDDILARAKQAGTIDAFVVTARNELAVATVRQKNGEFIVGLGRESVEAFDEFFGTLAKDHPPVSVNIDALKTLTSGFKETGSITGAGGRISQAEFQTLEQVASLADDGFGNLYFFDDLEESLVNMADEEFLNAAKEFVETHGDEIRRGFDTGPSVPGDVGAETMPWSPGALDPFGETMPFPPPEAGGHTTVPPPGFRDSPTEFILPGDETTIIFPGESVTFPSSGGSTTLAPPSGTVTYPPPRGSVTLPPPSGTVTVPPPSGSTTLAPPTLGPTQTWTATPDGGLRLTESLINPPPNVIPGGQSTMNWFLDWKDSRFMIHLFNPKDESPNMGIHPELYYHATNGLTFDGNYILVIDFPEGKPAETDGWIEQSQNISKVENDTFRVKKASNDPYFRSKGTWKQAEDDQWAIKRVGFSQEVGSAWSQVGTEKNEVVVAVIDSGLDWHHPDLTDSALWRNGDEIPGNGIDDDRNGYVDDIVGWNFIARTNIPWDRDGHGTFVAGLIAAKQNNGRGIAGINPHARIMVLKAVDDYGNTRASYLTEAIVYAADNGARVINLSVGGKKPTKAEQLAIAYAHSKGVVIVAAAGNEGENVDSFSPAGFENVITVAATDTGDKRAGFSNWGPSVDIAAPGIDVLSLRAHETDLMLNVPGIDYKPGDNIVGRDGQYFRASGTSFSAPIVAATASLLLTKNPDLTNTQVERMILHAAKDVETPGWDQFTGYGLLDAGAALQANPRFYLISQIQKVGPVQEDKKIFLEVTGAAEGSDFEEAIIEVGFGEKPEDWTEAAKIREPKKSERIVLVPVKFFTKPGQWSVRLIVKDKKGNVRESRASIKIE